MFDSDRGIQRVMRELPTSLNILKLLILLHALNQNVDGHRILNGHPLHSFDVYHLQHKLMALSEFAHML